MSFHSRVVDAAEIHVVIVGTATTASNATDSSAFKDLIRSMLHNAPLKAGTLVGFTVRCESFALRVKICRFIISLRID